MLDILGIFPETPNPNSFREWDFPAEAWIVDVMAHTKLIPRGSEAEHNTHKCMSWERYTIGAPRGTLCYHMHVMRALHFHTPAGNLRGGTKRHTT